MDLWRKNFKRRHAQKAHYWLERILGRVFYLRLLHKFQTGIYRKEVVETGILFFHVPKAAGTSVINALYRLDGYGHYRPEEAKAIDPELYSRLVKVCLVRNPYSRLLSAYNFARSGGTSDVSVVAMDRYKDMPGDFETFVTKWLPNRSLEEIGVFFHLQTDFISEDFDAVFKLEEISEFESYVSSIVGLDFSLPKKNSNSENDADYMSLYKTPEMYQVVNALYERDFRVLGYDMIESL